MGRQKTRKVRIKLDFVVECRESVAENLVEAPPGAMLSRAAGEAFAELARSAGSKSGPFTVHGNTYSIEFEETGQR